MDVFTPDITNQKVLAILDQVKSVFAQKGFDGASMQDLAQAAQMSVGNFYRYFPSKNAIITALVQRDLEQMQASFEAVHAADDPRQAFLSLLSDRLDNLPSEDAALWTEMQSASFRVPEIAELKRRMEETVRGNIVETLMRIDGGTSEEDRRRYGIQAHLVMLMVHGLAQRRYCTRDLDDRETNRALADLVFETLRQALTISGTKRN